MDENVYYVVQKGNVVGFYKNLKDCQDQDGYSIFGPDAMVYKGYNLSKEGEQFLASNGLQNATYSICASNVTNHLFGELLACPYHEEPSCSGGNITEEYSEANKPRQELETETKQHAYVGTVNHRIATNSSEYSSAKKPQQVLQTTKYEYVGTNFIETNSPKQQSSLGNGFGAASSSRASFILEFDGASKGNPGPAGAGAVLRAEDGTVVCSLREGVGIATNNVAEYRAVILGLKHALKNGMKHIRVQGDSKLVCMQVQGLWKIKNQNMAALCKVAVELKDQFISFEINHIRREFNSHADAQANYGIHLQDGEIVEDCKHK